MRKLVPILAALLLFAAACGSSGSDKSSKTDTKSSSTTTSSTASSESSGSASGADMAKAAGLTGTVNDHGTKSVAAGKSIEVEMDDKYFSPSYIQAPAGTAFTVELKNEGQLPHTFTVDSLNIDKQVDPGSSAEVKVTMPAKSTGFHCDFHGSMGMQGGLIVPGTAAAAAPSTSEMPTTTGSSSGY